MILNGVRFSLLDFKLSFRMLARYPGVTIVACLAIAVAIGLGVLYFEIVQKFHNPPIPLDEGDRIVGIRNWGTLVPPMDAYALYELAQGRTDLRTITDLTAVMRFERNLTTEDGRIEPVSGAEMTASAFGLTRAKPLLGRTLLPSDEKETEPAVVLIGYALWQTRFGGDRGVIGRTVKLGSMSATVVGVMEEGFAFPIQERIWTPLRLNAAQFTADGQPGTTATRLDPCKLRGLCGALFGRFAPGVSFAEAQAELDARASSATVGVSEPLRNGPLVRSLSNSFFPPDFAQTMTRVLYSVNIVFILLLTIICSNVATLVFARAATRAWEITVRNALGASRGRIVSQLFAEALALAGVGAVVGLAGAFVLLRVIIGLLRTQGARLPFWISSDLSPWTVLYAAGLTLFGAAIIGILPALRMTRNDIHSALRRQGSAKSALQFGGLWTTIIVVQVAITVAFIPLAVGGAMVSNRFEQRAEALNAKQYLSASLSLEPEIPARNPAEATAFGERAKARYQALEQKLLAQPEVEAVAFADRLPGMDQFKYSIEVDVERMSPSAIRTVTSASVAHGFFAAFRAPLLAGREFTARDTERQDSVVVNQSFVRHVFEGRNPIGQRVRFTGSGETQKPDHWYEIVGIVQDLGSSASEESPVEASALYLPITPGETKSVYLALRLRGSRDTVAQRLIVIAADIDPTLRVSDIVSLDQIGGGEAQINWMLTKVMWAVACMTLLLSATGIHALMAFTVTRRTREIGIRAALGAEPRRIVAGIFSRVFLQLGLGVLAGSGLVALWGLETTREVGLLLVAVCVMFTVGLISCAAPLRRALRVDPTEALRREG